jgi:hypothetical protein
VAELLTSLGAARGALAKDPASFSAAEANLVEACEIYRKVPGPSPSGPRLALQALVDLYAMRDKTEPGRGYDVKTAEWQAELDKMSASTRPTND